jgi:hypothetical protein
MRLIYDIILFSVIHNLNQKINDYRYGRTMSSIIKKRRKKMRKKKHKKMLKKTRWQRRNK